MTDKKMKEPESIKKILTRNLLLITSIVALIIVIVMTVMQVFYAQKKAYDDAGDRFVQIRHLMDDNRSDRVVVEDDLENKYLRNARIAAFMIQNHPELQGNPEALREIAAVLQLDEICIFDETGLLYDGTHPEYYGMTFDSGEQMAFFKPMLEDKSLELCQDIKQNTYDDRMMQYAAVWSESGEFIVEVGKSAEDSAMLLEKYDLSYIFSLLRVTGEAEFYAADSETGEIMGSTVTEDIGKNLADIGLKLGRIQQEKKGFHAEVNGEKCYCVFKADGKVLLGRIIPNRVIYSDVVPRTLEFTVILFLVVASLIYAIIKYMDKLVIRNMQNINGKLLYITEGYLNERIEMEDNLEFSQMSQYINEMVESLADKVQQRENFFNIVTQHSDRILYSFDLDSGTTKLWSDTGGAEDILSHIYSGEYTHEALEDNEFILRESRNDVKAFFNNIYNGTPSGETNVHISLKDGEKKWYNFKYSVIFDGDRPVTALISIEDITEDHEREIAHRRFTESNVAEVEQSISYMEADLTADIIEKHTGQELWSKSLAAGKPYSEYTESYSLGDDEENNAKLRSMYRIEALLSAYEDGQRNIEHVWEMQRGEDTIWVQAKTELAEDPYSGHIKAYVMMADVTQQQEEQRQMKLRAEYDTMTGLLRKEVGEHRIKEYLAGDHQENGIMIILDMDDLKGINDELGHRVGDEAISSIARVMREYFSSEDILVRAGGDEFVALIKDGRHVSNMGDFLTGLLKRLAAISVGENSEKNVHCSAGCAAVSASDSSYDDVFKRADVALYHVKRNGKNNYAFYTPEMEQENYEFRSKKLLSMESVNKFGMVEMQHLLDTIIKFYQLVLSVNVSANTYHIMEEIKEGVFAAVPDFGVLDDFVVMSGSAIHPEDRELFYSKLSRKALIEAYERGEDKVQHTFRFQTKEQLRKVECMVNFYVDDNGDICDFTILRWAD